MLFHAFTSLLLIGFSLISAQAQMAMLGPQDFSDGPVEMREAKPLNLNQIRNEVGYPAKAQLSGVEGKVVCRIQVNEHGEYVRHSLVKTADLILVEAVENHIAGLRFEPALIEERPVTSWVKVHFSFYMVEDDEHLPERPKWDDYLEWAIDYREAGQYDLARSYFDQALASGWDAQLAEIQQFGIYRERRIAALASKDWRKAFDDLAIMISLARQYDEQLGENLPYLIMERAFAALMLGETSQAYQDYLLLGERYADFHPEGSIQIFSLSLTPSENRQLLAAYKELKTYQGTPRFVEFLQGIYAMN